MAGFPSLRSHAARVIASDDLGLHIRRMQPSLFADAERTIVDDERGSIRYIPDAITPEDAASWFAALRDRVDWRSERRMMYDREVDVPRLLSSYRLDDSALPAE